INITPELDASSNTGKVGVTAKYAPVPTRAPSFVETITFGAESMKNMTINIFEGFKMLILGQFDLDDLGGPVKTAQVTGQIAAQGIEQLTSWTAILSL